MCNMPWRLLCSFFYMRFYFTSREARRKKLWHEKHFEWKLIYSSVLENKNFTALFRVSVSWGKKMSEGKLFIVNNDEIEDWKVRRNFSALFFTFQDRDARMRALNPFAVNFSWSNVSDEKCEFTAVWSINFVRRSCTISLLLNDERRRKREKDEESIENELFLRSEIKRSFIYFQFMFAEWGRNSWWK